MLLHLVLEPHECITTLIKLWGHFRQPALLTPTRWAEGFAALLSAGVRVSFGELATERNADALDSAIPRVVHVEPDRHLGRRLRFRPPFVDFSRIPNGGQVVDVGSRHSDFQEFIHNPAGDFDRGETVFQMFGCAAVMAGDSLGHGSFIVSGAERPRNGALICARLFLVKDKVSQPARTTKATHPSVPSWNTPGPATRPFASRGLRKSTQLISISIRQVPGDSK
jgi:hypothetical protein